MVGTGTPLYLLPIIHIGTKKSSPFFNISFLFYMPDVASDKPQRLITADDAGGEPLAVPVEQLLHGQVGVDDRRPAPLQPGIE